MKRAAGDRNAQRVTYGPDPAQFVDVHRPDGDPCGTIVSIHGGYWRSRHGLDLNEPMCLHLAGRGWLVINIEYRRIEPDRSGVWPEMAADIMAACSLMSEGAMTIAIGHSAGGHLALWAAAQPGVSIDTVVALAPVADLEMADALGLSDHAVRELLGHRFDRERVADALASPRHILPLGHPQLIVHGTADVDVPPAVSRAYARTAELAGDTVRLHESEGVDHFDIIDPNHAVWRTVDEQLDYWLASRQEHGSDHD